MQKMNTFANSLALIMLIFSYDVIMALETTKKTNLHSLKKISSTNKLKKDLSTQAHPSQPQTEPSNPTSTAPSSAPSQTPTKNPFIPANSQIAEIISLDQSGTTIQTDPYSSKAINSQLYLTCKAKFYSLIAALPDSLQSAVLSEFAANTQSNSCCQAEKLILTVSSALNSQVTLFANLLTNKQRSAKKGFVCFRAPEIVAKEEDLPLEQSFSEKNKEFINKMLLEQNTLSSNLLKCVNAINKISIRNLGLMCSSNDMIDKLFNKDTANTYRLASIKKFPDDDKNIYNECVEYVKKQDSFSNTVLGAYVDSFNFLIGTDKCNYFSNLFTMDPLKDKDDPYLPKDFAELAQSANNNSNKNTNFNINNNTNSPNAMLNTWFSCASAKSEFSSAIINDLKTNITRAQYTNPFGLSTYIGRADVNYSLIKQKFDLVSFPYYHVKCGLVEGCSASFKGSSNSKQVDLASVVTGPQTKMEVSCCNFICVVYVRIEDMHNASQNSNGGLSSTKQLEGAEVYKMKSDRNSLDISSLDLLEIRNAKNCFNKNSLNPVSFIEKANSEQALPTNNNNGTIYTPNSTPTANSAEKKFANTNLIKILSDLYSHSANYENDFRLKSSTMLKVTFDGKTRTLNDLLYSELFKAENSMNYLQCERGACLLQQAFTAEAANTPDKIFNLEPNADKASISLKGQVSNKKSSSSGSKSSSSGSSFSKPSSSSSSSGSSFSKPSSSGSSFSKPSSSSSSSSRPSSGSNGFNSATNYGSSGSSSSNSIKKNPSSSSSSSFSGSSSGSNGFNSAMNNGSNSGSGVSKSSSTGSSFPGSSSNSNNNNSGSNGFNSAMNSGTNSGKNNNSFSGYSSNSNKSNINSGSNGFNSATNNKPSSGFSSSSSSGSSFNTSLYPSTNKNQNSNLNKNTNSINNNNNKSNSYFNNNSNTNNYYITNNNNNKNNFSNTSANSNYATKIKISSSPNSSFNSNYYNNLYSSNYGYSTLKVKVSNPQTSISSYNHGYSTYNSNSYISSIKIKGYGIKVKIKYYPSYTYNPIYSNVFYPFNRYYQYNYNSYYYRPNYYNYYYQNQSYYNNNPTYSQMTFNSLNLSPEYNAEDWLPNFNPYFDREANLNSLSANLTSIKIYSQCCETWCAYVIQNNNDGLKAENSTKQRIYVEVILKNYAFFDSSTLSASQKKCLTLNIQESLSANAQKDNNIFQKCGIKSPYDVIPVKRNCLKNINEHCKANGFSDLMEQSAIYVQSSDSSSSESSSSECLAPLDCLGLSSPNESQMQACGASLNSLFSVGALKPAFKSFIYPCAKNNIGGSAARITAMIEKSKKQSPPSSNNSGSSISNSDSNVVNMSDFSAEQKLKLESVNKLAANQVNANIAIDNNTAVKVNTNTDADAKSINSETDSAVVSAIIDTNASADGSYNNFDSVYTSGFNINFNTLFGVLLTFLLI
jgi:hypothetical protein